MESKICWVASSRNGQGARRTSNVSAFHANRTNGDWLEIGENKKRSRASGIFDRLDRSRLVCSRNGSILVIAVDDVVSVVAVSADVTTAVIERESNSTILEQICNLQHGRRTADFRTKPRAPLADHRRASCLERNCAHGWKHISCDRKRKRTERARGKRVSTPIPILLETGLTGLPRCTKFIR